MSAQMGKPKSGLLSRFLSDARGSVAMIAGLSAIPLMLAAGVAVDMARASHEQQAFQAALDSAALAVGASPDSNVSGLTPVQLASRYDKLKTLARKYIAKNYTPKFHDDTQIAIDISITNNDKILVKGYHDFPTTIMQLAGIDEMDISATAEVNKQHIPNPAVEIALVMDTTGSMGMPISKLNDAKAAAKDLLDIIYDGHATSPYIKVALVPFAQTVNVGADKRDSGWIDKDGLAPYSHTNFTDPAWHNMRAWDALSNRPWTGCVEARSGAYDTDDTAPSTLTPATLFTPWFAPDEPNPSPSLPSPYNASPYNNKYTDSTGGQAFSNDWITGDAAETNSLATADKAKALMRQMNYRKYNGAAPSTSSSIGPWYGCKGTSPIIPLTNVKQTIVDGVNALTAASYTHVNVGAVWGWRVLSPGAPYTEGAAYSDPHWKKIMIIMTDGDNTYPPYSDGNYNSNSYKTVNKSDYSSYGFLQQNKLGTTNVTSADTFLDTKLTTVCNNAKASPNNIEIWTVGFDVSTTSPISTLLRNCATDTSKYMNSPTGTQLRAAFQAIGQSILETSLYISK